MRTFSYTNTDVFLVCFSVMSPTSFNNALKMWIDEIRQSSSSRAAPFVLVGTKTDLRTSTADVEFLAKSKQKPITREQGERVAKEYGAHAYIECSACSYLSCTYSSTFKTYWNFMLLFITSTYT
jgi:GTPase SAR1 family protein